MTALNRIDIMLEPFLEVLQADGFVIGPRDYERIALALSAWPGAWTGDRLAEVLCPLLVTSEDEAEHFQRHFDGFFTLSADEEMRSQAWSVANVLPPRKGEDEHTSLPPKTTKNNNTATTIHKLSIYQQLKRTINRAITIFATITVAIASIFATLSAIAALGPGYVAILFFVTPAVFVFIILLRAAIHTEKRQHKQISVPELPAPLPTTIRTFFSQIPPRLSRHALDEFADGLGRFIGTTLGHELDVAETIDASVVAGGFTELRFRRLRHDRQVVILEDLTSESRGWNAAADELAEGLTQRGIALVRGWFHGSPATCQSREGGRLDLDDLDHDRQGYLLLIFSDGQGLHPRDRVALESLARWPFAAWMDLRDPALWDETPVRLRKVGIPVFPASDTGLAGVGQLFLSERAPDKATHFRSGRAPAFVALDSPALATMLAAQLGDVLEWACDCAMAQPLLPLGLADALRREYHPHLPPERLDRLIALPGTRFTNNGLTLADPVLKELRQGFLRRPDHEQNAVLAFILAEMKQLEPAKPGSTAHLEWRLRYARVQVDLDADAAANELRELRASLLGPAVIEEFSRFTLSEDRANAHQRIPLLRRPRSERGRECIARLTGIRPQFKQMGTWRNLRRLAWMLGPYYRLLFSHLLPRLLGTSRRPLTQKAVNLIVELHLHLRRSVIGTFSRDGTIFAVAWKRRVEGYRGDERIFSLPLEFRLSFLKLSPAGTYLAAVTEEGEVVVWEVDSGSQVCAHWPAGRSFQPLDWVDEETLAVASGAAVEMLNIFSGISDVIPLSETATAIRYLSVKDAIAVGTTSKINTSIGRDSGETLSAMNTAYIRELIGEHNIVWACPVFALPHHHEKYRNNLTIFFGIYGDVADFIKKSHDVELGTRMPWQPFGTFSLPSRLLLILIRNAPFMFRRRVTRVTSFGRPDVLSMELHGDVWRRGTWNGRDQINYYTWTER